MKKFNIQRTYKDLKSIQFRKEDDNKNFKKIIGVDIISKLRKKQQEQKKIKKQQHLFDKKQIEIEPYHNNKLKEIQIHLQKFIRQARATKMAKSPQYIYFLKQSQDLLNQTKINFKKTPFHKNNYSHTFERNSIISMTKGIPIQPYVTLPTLCEHMLSKIEQREIRRNKKRNIVQNIANQTFFDNSCVIHQEKITRKEFHRQLFDRAFQALDHTIKNSKAIINTMKNFYEVKKYKDSEMMKMVRTIKRDRPLTSFLRKKEFNQNNKYLQSGTNTNVHTIRKKAEQQRNQIYRGQSKDISFYLRMLDHICKFNGINDYLPFSHYLCLCIKTLIQDGIGLKKQMIEKYIEQYDKNQGQFDEFAKIIIKLIQEQLNLNNQYLISKINKYSKWLLQK